VRSYDVIVVMMSYDVKVDNPHGDYVVSCGSVSEFVKAREWCDRIDTC